MNWQPAIQVRRPVGSSAHRRGMVLCVVAVLAMWWLAKLARDLVVPSDNESRSAAARWYVRTAVYDGYVAWKRAHPDEACPRSLTELQPIDLLDPWRTPLRYSCSATKVLVVSAGADGQFGTVDDIRSDE